MTITAAPSYALLADGGTVEIRPAGPGDCADVREMHAQMSPDKTYLRFFSLSALAPEREAQRLCRPAGPDHAALLARLSGELIGVASYEPTTRPGVAEIAFAVRDDMHGRGVATLLLEHLVSLARQRGLIAFAGETPPENTEMQKVFADAGVSDALMPHETEQALRTCGARWCTHQMSTQPAFAFGIFDSFDLGESSPGQVIASRLDFAVAAEAAGIGHYHVTEHHGTPLSVCPSPNLFLAALSQRTTTMRMGALVHVLPSYEPLRLAEEIATLDQLTHGRLDVGVGSGVSPYELAYFGIDADEARDRYAETLAAVTGALASGRLTHRGVLLRDYDVELSVVPVQRPHPPLWYASSNTRSAQWAAANDVNFVGKWSGGSFAPAVQAYWQTWQDKQEASARPTPPRVGAAAHIYIGDTDADAAERFRKAGAIHFGHLLSLWHKNGNHAFDFMADLEAGMASGNALVGSAQTVRDQLIEQVRQAPVNYFEATLAYGDLTPEEAHANLAAFAETVMPAVREAAAERPPAVPAG